MCTIFDEIKRVLKKEGTCWVNLGDTYSGSCQGSGKNIEHLSKKTMENLGSTKVYLQKYSHTINQKPPNHKTSVSPKSLCLIPERFAIEMVNRGWILRNRCVWYKRNSMPSSVKDRFSNKWEYVFFFVKNKKYYFNLDAVRKPHKISSINRINAGFSKKVLGISHDSANVHPLGGNPGDLWDITTRPHAFAHFACYPERLCEMPIKAGCPEKGIVLDPFLGSGTTAVMALKLNRKFIGIELNQEYIEIAKKRIGEVDKKLI